ncbi:DNA primase family protein [Pseudogracilibacillus sp. SO10305]|uniref:DNA primase family protein n=1 Tax=Pseudogracilibacillus sp. SO10305 TaxID=3098292 RepID=UPI00300E1CB3
MYKIQNKKNLHFIRQFIKVENKLVIEKQTRSDLFESFISSVKEGNLTSIQVLNDLNEHLLAPICMESLLEGTDVNFNPGGSSILSEEVKESFHEFILDVGRIELEYNMSESGRISFNKKSFAELVMELMALVVDRKDPETILVYNNQKGFWEKARQPLHRLIIEIAHAAGGNIEDTWTSHLESSIVDILKRKVAFIQSLNFNKSHFPLGNHTLDSITGDLVPHAPSHLATFGSPVNHNEEARCPNFTEFLEGLFEDEETIQFVQEFFGYTLSCSHQSNSFLIGVGAGANGKSTLFDILAQLVGIENVSSAPLSNFNTEFGLEPLIGKKLNLATESDLESFKSGKLKAICSGETISVNRKNRQEVNVVLNAKLTFLMNELPLLSDDSFGFERRLLILPFDRIFLPHEQDKDLPKKLSKELEGILNWSLEGLRHLIANNYTFTVSKSMLDAKELYLGVGNPIEKFVKECIDSVPAKVMPAKDLLNAYKNWMMLEKLPFKGTDNPQKFWKMFQEAMNLELISFTRGKSNGITVVRDIGLK